MTQHTPYGMGHNQTLKQHYSVERDYNSVITPHCQFTCPQSRNAWQQQLRYSIPKYNIQ